MRALKLIQHMKANADRMSEEVMRKIRSSERCNQLLLALPAEEQKQSTLNVYRDLTAWLGTESDATIEQRYPSRPGVHVTTPRDAGMSCRSRT